MTVTLSITERHALYNAAAWFLPRSDRYPSFADADPNHEVLALVLQQLVPLQNEIRTALAAVPSEGIEQYMDGLQTVAPDQFDTLRTLCLGWYFTCRPVWNLLGYIGRRPVPIKAGEAEHFLRDGILDPVIERGKIYRPTPTVCG